MNRRAGLRGAIGDLRHPDPERRRRAAEVLGAADERAVYPLIGALRDVSPAVQDAARRSLAAIGGEATAWMVLPLLREEAAVRNAALLVLEEIGAPAAGLLPPLFRDKDDDVRKFAADLAAAIGTCPVPGALADLVLSDPNPNVRAAAAKAVAALGYRDGIPALVAALGDEEWVRFSALEALGAMGAAEAAGEVEKLLGDPSPAVRCAAAETLAEIGGPRAARALSAWAARAEGEERTAAVRACVRAGADLPRERTLETLLGLLRAQDLQDRLLAVQGLARLREEKTLGAVLDVVGALDPTRPDEGEALEAAVRSLREWGCERALLAVAADEGARFRARALAAELLGDLASRLAVPTLAKLLAVDLRDVRRAAAAALGRIGDPRGLKALLGALGDPDGQVRRAAASALGRLRRRESVPFLLDLLQRERDEDVREEAARALAALGAEAGALRAEPARGAAAGGRSRGRPRRGAGRRGAGR